MPDRVERILKSIDVNAGDGVFDKIIKSCGEIDKKVTTKKQSSYVKTLVCELGNLCGEEVTANVMKPCGHQCVSDNAIKKAKSLYLKAQDIEDFLRLLNEQRIGGGGLYVKDDKIIGVYEKCYCGLAKASEGFPALYCYCSAGWYERLFASVFERDVKVKKIHTILEGADQCMFEITVQR